VKDTAFPPLPASDGMLVEKLVAGGEGLCFDEGKAVFVPGVIPGERVRVRLRQSRRDYARAELREVLAPSPHRITPPCRLAGTCGGCDWMHIRYEEQLSLKVAIVQEALRRTGGIECGPLAIQPSPPLAARNRAQVHRDAEGRLGYMAARSERIVPARDCPIVAPPIEEVLRGDLPAPDGLDRFTVWSDGRSCAVEGRDDERDLVAEVCGRQIRFSVGCFFQSNLAVLETLVPWALAGLDPAATAAGAASPPRAADLYCGVGLFGSFLADRGFRVTCVESGTLSLGYARRNVPGPDHAFHPMSVESWIVSGAAREPFAAVVVDPPRPGISPEVRAWLCARPPRRLVYVSCNPVTLARDLGALTTAGLGLEELRLFDFYPQTSHIEAVARLRGPS
jgi:23S rRNA (uracil1939-C5)-methyltransferase